MTPREANTFKKLYSLWRDNFPTPGKRWTALVSENDISLLPPYPIEGYVAISIPKTEFNKIIDWYNKDQKTK